VTVQESHDQPTSSADRYGLPGTARIPDRRGRVLVGDGIEPADHYGGRIGLASSTVASGDRPPQRMSGWRQLKVWGCVSDGARKRMELGQSSFHCSCGN